MCGRYVFIPPSNFNQYYQINFNVQNLAPNYNVSPGQLMPIIINENGKNLTELMQWGYQLGFTTSSGKKITPINFRAETLLAKPYFKNALEKRRCLIPATGFYEWRLQNNKKVPYYFYVKNTDLFSFAGIYDKGTYAIITTAPNPVVKQIHNRMPVVLKKPTEEEWLYGNSLNKFEELLLSPFTEQNMDFYEVSPLINTSSENSQNLIKRKN